MAVSLDKKQFSSIISPANISTAHSKTHLDFIGRASQSNLQGFNTLYNSVQRSRPEIDSSNRQPIVVDYSRPIFSLKPGNKEAPGARSRRGIVSKSLVGKHEFKLSDYQ